MLVGMPLDVTGIIGIILLIGIVKKNGIMLVDFALAEERDHGLSSEDAIHRACLLRFRPILMTTLAVLLAGVPLTLGTGIGSEIRQPLGYAIVGGLFISQLLTLFTTPVVYIYMDRLRAWLGGEFEGAKRSSGGFADRVDSIDLKKESLKERGRQKGEFAPGNGMGAGWARPLCNASFVSPAVASTGAFRRVNVRATLNRVAACCTVSRERRTGFPASRERAGCAPQPSSVSAP